MEEGHHTNEAGLELTEDLRAAIEGIIEAKSVGRDIFKQWRAEKPNMPFPPMLPAADGRGSTPITPAGYEALARWIRQQYNSDGDLKRQLVLSEWSSVVTAKFLVVLGDVAAIPGLEAKDLANPGSFEKRLRKQLKSTAALQHIAPRVHFFPASFAAEPLTKRLALGPVTFVPVTEIEDEVRGIFTDDSQLARDACEQAIKNVNEWVNRTTAFICVHTSELGEARADQLARAAARLALVSVLLPIGPPAIAHAHLLDEPWQPIMKKGMTFRTDSVTFPGWSFDSTRLREGDAIAHDGSGDYAAYCVALGRMLDSYVVDGEASSAPWRCPKLGDRWLSAVHWFHRGMTTKLDFEAVTYFGICLDTLANGGKANGIIEVATSVLNLKADDFYFDKQPRVTVKKIVKEIYERGRSQVSHGTQEALRRDYSASRMRAQLFVHNALSAYGNPPGK